MVCAPSSFSLRSNHPYIILDVITLSAFLYFYGRHILQEERRLQLLNDELARRNLPESDSANTWLNQRYNLNHRVQRPHSPPSYTPNQDTLPLLDHTSFFEPIPEDLPGYYDQAPPTFRSSIVPDYLVFENGTVNWIDGDSRPGFAYLLRSLQTELNRTNHIRRFIYHHFALPQVHYDLQRYRYGRDYTIHDHQEAYRQCQEWDRERIERERRNIFVALSYELQFEHDPEPETFIPELTCPIDLTGANFNISRFYRDLIHYAGQIPGIWEAFIQIDGPEHRWEEIEDDDLDASGNLNDGYAPDWNGEY
ncbi:hypothetical protein BV22DRAFT_1135153 [Leucogyrophana mollusca]|uniref:Uncharacterized protein n=1 Tax=Leucogyrophana mollusca TaxID=85980 RepID=A0ACB8AW58_9AGAM|nr:hypothetical protein BV22DRAFT_1135153 [Leucogyrophana mollusca]